MPLFSPKKTQDVPSVPVDIVFKMKEQGFNNTQIVQALQREGYKSHQIFDALNQSEIQAAGPIDGQIPPAPDLQQEQQSMQNSQPMQQEQQVNYPYPQQNMSSEQQSQTMDKEQIEEITESIIEEKWTDFMKSVSKIIEWKETVDTRFTKYEEQLKAIKDDFDKLHSAVLGKITDYDKNIIDVGIEVKALGKTFEKILPTFTENVSELTRITSKMKNK